MAQQQQNLAPKNISFDVGNVTFSHHMTPVNGIQLHYVIGGHGDPPAHAPWTSTIFILLFVAFVVDVLYAT
jgi:hypothetical protein